MDKNRLIVGVSGASGAPIAIELLRQLIKISEIETHLIVTKGAEATLFQEAGMVLEELKALADVTYDNEDLGAAPASGSYRTDGMIIVPCSMKTLAGVVDGYSDNLLLRAADVTLKEKRKLVLVARECPFSTIHLRNLLEASHLGVTVFPPVISYYSHPVSAADCTRHIAGRILDQFGIEDTGYLRWEGMKTT